MGTTHEKIQLEDSSGNVLMYFPITSTVERVVKNSVTVRPVQWSRGGPLVININQYAFEVVIQGTFISSDAPADADFVADLRALPSAPASWAAGVITAQDQYNLLLENILDNDAFRLKINDDYYAYSSGSVDISDGKYPPPCPVELRDIAEGSADRLGFVMRFAVGQRELPRN